MKIKTLINALSKAGLKVDKIAHSNTRSKYICKNQKHVLSWYDDSYFPDDATCVHIARHDDEDDLMTDYFAGSFYKTIKSVIKSMTE
jgi:hypothetical protein